MVPRVTLGKKRTQGSIRQAETLPIVRNNDSLFRYGDNIAVHFEVGLLTVDSRCSFDQLCRINHVRCAARVQHSFRVWQMSHELPGATGVIEVYVRQENVVNITNIEVLLFEAIQQKWHAEVCAGVNESSSAAFDNQVTCIKQRSNVVGINGCNAMIQFGGSCRLT